MILEQPLRIVGFAGVMAGSWLVILHAHACAPRACAPSCAMIVAAPVPVVTPVPDPAHGPVVVTPAPAAKPGEPPAAPTVTLPCVDESTELLVADHLPVVCWGERCLAYRDDTTTSVPRPELPEPEPEAIVDAQRVCTGARCDQLGPKLRARIAGSPPGARSATRDHAAIVVDGPTHFEVWNRAADRPVSLGKPGPDDGELDRIDVIGDHLMVARSCNEYCSDGAFVIDARGRHHGSGFALAPRWSGPQTNVVAVDTDLFVVFGGFGEIAMISHGRSVATADFLPESTRKPIQVAVHAVALDHETVAAEWCTPKMCHLTRIFLGGTDPDSERSYIDLSEATPLPSCPG